MSQLFASGGQSIGYYSAIKRKEIRSFVEMSMDLESIIQIEVS